MLLDRAGFSPGEIDGNDGPNSRKGLAAFGKAHRIASGARDRAALLKALRAGALEPLVTYTITAEDAGGPFLEAVPEDMAERAKLPGLYCTAVLEEVSEKFHSAPAPLKRLNPAASFAAGEQIRVPNVLISDNPVAGQQDGSLPALSAAARVVVTKKTSSLTVLDRRRQVLFYAPVTSGSEHDPLPFGEMDGDGGPAESHLQLQSRLVLGCRPAKCPGEDCGRTEQSGRHGVD